MKNWEKDTIATFHKRKNTEIEEAVEEGIRLLDREGMNAAIQYMVERDVPISVAKRVTLAPQLRRTLKHKGNK